MLARMEGAWRAVADMLVFLDSHIEATPGWLEPLLARIVEDRLSRRPTFRRLFQGEYA